MRLKLSLILLSAAFYSIQGIAAPTSNIEEITDAAADDNRWPTASELQDHHANLEKASPQNPTDIQKIAARYYSGQIWRHCAFNNARRFIGQAETAEAIARASIHLCQNEAEIFLSRTHFSTTNPEAAEEFYALTATSIINDISAQIMNVRSENSAEK